MNDSICLRRITPADAETLRDIRLRALQDAPSAFGSTWAKESTFTASQWQARADGYQNGNRCVGFFARRGEDLSGIVACFREDENPQAGLIVSMWVNPNARRMGLGKSLICAVEDWAVEQKLQELRLTVTENNLAAIRLYEHCGFCPTGGAEPYPNDPVLREIVMRKILSHCSAT